MGSLSSRISRHVDSLTHYHRHSGIHQSCTARNGRVTNFRCVHVYLQHQTNDDDDAVAVGQALNGNPSAFEALVQRHHRVLFNIAFRMLGDYDEATDATQNAFVKAYQKLGTFDGEHRFFSWIYRILVNECLNAQRSQRLQEAVDPELVADGDPLESLEASERHDRVKRAILALPHEYREVIVLRYFADLSYGDIATAVGVPAKTVKSRLHTARQRLAEMLANA